MTRIGEEKAEAELDDLLRIEVLAQAEHVGEVMAGQFDRGFADLERGFGRFAATTFQHGDRQLRMVLAQLQRQRQASEATAEDQYVAHERFSASSLPASVMSGLWISARLRRASM